MNIPEFLTRKDVSRIALCSTRCVEYNEELWGMLPFRRTLNKRVVRYEPALDALKALVKNGVVHSMEQAVYRLNH